MAHTTFCAKGAFLSVSGPEPWKAMLAMLLVDESSGDCFLALEFCDVLDDVWARRRPMDTVGRELFWVSETILLGMRDIW